MPTERILITVRTYPVPSRTYIETVCTGGINDQGKWRRLFPVDLRYLEIERQYKTYDVIQIQLQNSSDSRPESRRPNLQTIKKIDHLDEWSSRCQWINPTIMNSMDELIDRERTIAPVAVSEVLEFQIKRDAENWTPEQLDKLSQKHLFRKNKALEKVPYKFRIRWVDGDKKEHVHTYTAWEVHQTWRNWRRMYDDDVNERIRDKWLNEVCNESNQLSFYMGNYARRPKQFSITGIFNPPRGVASHDTLW